jgi:hypothetical protein
MHSRTPGISEAGNSVILVENTVMYIPISPMAGLNFALINSGYMQKRNLGNSGLEVSAIGMGCMNLSFGNVRSIKGNLLG